MTFLKEDAAKQKEHENDIPQHLLLLGKELQTQFEALNNKVEALNSKVEKLESQAGGQKGKQKN